MPRARQFPEKCRGGSITAQTRGDKCKRMSFTFLRKFTREDKNSNSLNLVFWLLFKSQALVLWLEFDISLLASSLTTQYKFVVKVLQYSQYYIQQPFKFPQNLKTLHWLTMFSKDFSGSLGGILCLRRPNKITLSGIIILKHTIVRITSV